MDQIINELSANGTYQDRNSADRGMQQLLTVSRGIVAIGFQSSIRTTRNFVNRKLVENYSVYAWATETTTNTIRRDFQRYFLTLATKSPYIEDFFDKEEGGRLFEYQYDTETAFGVGLAELWGIPVLSLGSDAKFRVDYINATKMIIDEEGDSNQKVQVLNLWKPSQIEAFRDQLVGMIWQNVMNGKDLINELPHLLPHLKVCNNAHKQIEALRGSEQFFPEILRHLRILNKTMADYANGPFEPTGINWSVDSSSTLKKYPECRTFFCNDGEKRIFSCHSKILSANKRIYFFPLPHEKIVYIGYLGDHLPTVNYS